MFESYTNKTTSPNATSAGLNKTTKIMAKTVSSMLLRHQFPVMSWLFRQRNPGFKTFQKNLASSMWYFQRFSKLSFPHET